MAHTFWPEFSILFAMALLGAAAIMPYTLRLLKGSGKPLKMPVPKLLLLSFLQTVVISAVTVGFGLFIAHKIGLGAPYIEAALSHSGTSWPLARMLEVAIGFGALSGLVLLVADVFFLPYWPASLLETTRKTTVWENFTASFYGGINEEFLIRLFGLSLLAWLLSIICHTSTGLPTAAVLWTSNIILTILFGLGHLPAIKNLSGKISPAMFMRSLLLNAPIGLLCGWLFWNYGIEAAVLAHFSADIIYHVFGTIILQRKLATQA